MRDESNASRSPCGTTFAQQWSWSMDRNTSLKRTVGGAKPRRSLLLQSVLFDFAEQRAFADAEQLGGFGALAFGQFQRAGDVVLFNLGQRLADQRVGAVRERVVRSAVGDCERGDVLPQV